MVANDALGASNRRTRYNRGRADEGNWVGVLFGLKEGTKMRRVILGLAMAWCVCGAALGAGEASSHLMTVREQGRLTMLCWPHQESRYVRRMVELGAEGLNQFTGIDVDLMAAFAKEMGVELHIKPVQGGFSDLIPDLLAGQGDLVASSMTITEGRAARVDFSVPYHGVRKVVITRAGSSIDALSALEGKVAATVAGSSHEEHLVGLGLPALQLHHVDFALEAYQAVAYGDADFALVDSDSAALVLPKYPSMGEKLEIAFEFPERDYYGIAVRPGSDLKDALDAFLGRQRARGALVGLD